MILLLTACSLFPAPEPEAPPPPVDPLTALLPEGFVRADQGPVIASDLRESGGVDHVLFLTRTDDPDYIALAVLSAGREPTLTADLTKEAFRYEENVPLALDGRVIVYSHQSMRHDWVAKFRFEASIDDFALIGLDRHFYGIEGGNESINYLVGKRIDTVRDADGLETKHVSRFTVEPLPRMSDNVWDMTLGPSQTRRLP